jgi:hypothetical protein
MRDDLTHALAVVAWADAHIPVMQERFIAWKRSGPYNVDVEPDPRDADWELLVAYLGVPLDSLIQGDVGAIINSMRTALDIPMSALLAGQGIEPNRKVYFPIRRTEADFLAAITVLEGKKWITPGEATAIKRAKAYKGGDDVFFPVHQLDILRKHERLLTVGPTIRQAHLTAYGPEFELILQHMDDKTILFRFPKGRFRPTKGNNQVSAEIILDEAALGIAHKPAIPTLRVFTAKIRTFIKNFP